MKKLSALILALLVVAVLTPSQSSFPPPITQPPDLLACLTTQPESVCIAQYKGWAESSLATHDVAIQQDHSAIVALQAQAPIPGPQGPQGVPGNPSSTIGILVYPNTIVYNPQSVNTTSPPQFVMVSNQTSVALPLTSPALVGPFQLGGGGNCGSLTSLPAGQNCVYGVQFRTGSVGAKTGTLTVNVGGLQLAVNLDGMGQ